MQNDTIEISYDFDCDDGSHRKFAITLDKKTVLLKNNPKPVEWAKMENFRCPVCPLQNEKYCPLALQLPEIIEFFSNIYSYQIANITVKTDERIYVKETSVQRGLSSLLGIIMPASGCPILAKLKPMIPFHLPFASAEETEYRVFSTYLFAQYLRYKAGLKPDWEMKKLENLYEEIRLVNHNIVKKLQKLSQKDANLNAVVILDTFTGFISMSLEDTDFSDLIDYFRDYLE